MNPQCESVDPTLGRCNLNADPAHDVHGAPVDVDWRTWFEPVRERCPVCGGLNPGDISHTRCQ